MKNEKTILIALILCGMVIKFVNIGYTNCISTNGLYFVTLAENLLNGEYDKAFSAYIPILYPVLIAISHFLFNNLELSGQIISAVSGIGIILILYHLGKEMFGSRIGILMALFGAISPVFNTYSSRVMDDMPFCALYTWSVYAGWRFLKKQNYKTGILFAVLAALSYYIRPEGIGIIVIVSGWFICSYQWKTGIILKRGLLIVAINMLFIVCIMPQILMIYKISGDFSFSGKTSYVLRDIDKFDKKGDILNGDAKPDNSMFGPEDSERAQYKEQGGLIGVIINHPWVIMKKLEHNLADYISRIPRAIGYLLIIPLFFAIGYRKEFKYKKKEEFFLLSIIVFNLVILSLFKEKYRHVMFAVSLLYVWCAIGLYEMIHLIKARNYKLFFKIKENMLFPVILSICVVTILPQTFSNIQHYDYTWGSGAQKKTGKWMTENITKDARIISWDAGKVMYYSGLAACFRLNHHNDYQYVMDSAKKVNADYIILNSHSSRRTRESIVEFSKQIKDDDMTFCYKATYAHSNGNIQVYKFNKKDELPEWIN
ncbi:MAG: ArnT family glycosyltransferase [Candidatus Anammoxibacter sp.]